VSKTCFVIMPITTPLEARSRYHGDAEHFVHVFDHLFKPALQAADYAVMGPLVENSEVIQGEIIKNLNSFDLALCDISPWNANVFFELGIRVALNKPVALVRDNLTSAIPFDNSIVSCHEYDASLTPWRLLTEVEMLKNSFAAQVSRVKTHSGNTLA
jgi:nucleoside 2-deoxyribosyltransferase